MAPAGLVISKLALQAIASDELVKGFLCLKVSLPRDTENAKTTRWALFSSSPPKVIAAPGIYPLPLPHSSHRPHHLLIAQKILSLSTATNASASYSSREAKPYLDVSKTNRQVYVVMDGSSARRRQSSGDPGSSSSTPSKSDRREYLIILEIELGISSASGDSSFVSIPLPKCLDNTVRFQIASSDNDGEVSIVTEPKLLPLPPGSLSSTPTKHQYPPSASLRTNEEGWEDGEDHSDDEATGQNGHEHEQNEESGSWLEGRFQSTDTLRLEWSFAPSASSSSPFLQITPLYDRSNSSIHLSYESPVTESDSLECILPPGWGFSALSLTAPGLRGWRCVDDPYSNTRLCSYLVPITPNPADQPGDFEDSFATIRAPRRPPSHTSRGSPRSSTSSSKPSLLRQTIPEMKVEDFSFEMNEDSILSDTTIAPMPFKTPSRGGGLPTKEQDVPGISLRWPAAGRVFELDFDSAQTENGLLALQAVIVPLSRRTLVAPGVPVQMPRMMYGDARCLTSCPKATYGDQTTSEAVSLSDNSEAYFYWSDHHGHPIQSQPPSIIASDVKIRVDLPAQGLVLGMELLNCPAGGIFSFDIPRPAEKIRLKDATSLGQTLAHSVRSIPSGTRFYLCSGTRGSTSVILEVDNVEQDEVVLPQYANAKGRAVVAVPSYLSDLKASSASNVKRTSPTTYSYDLSASPPPVLAFLPTATVATTPSTRGWGILSWSTLLNLFMLWLLLSMAQQVQRLRTEVAWVADEARDLRLYHEVLRQAPPAPPFPQSSADTPPACKVERKDQTELEVRHTEGDMSTALGRVVFGRSGWDRFSTHPTVRTLSKGLGWLWHTVVWLVIPTI